MDRRGFFRLAAKLVTVGAAMNVAPELLKPIKAFLTETIFVDASAGPITIILPSPTLGRIFTVKKVDATANRVTII